MAAPRPVSPILDGFRLEKPICQHGAAVCYAAVETGSSDPFVVKIISLPASPVQMEALLIAGAFADRKSANAYFKEQARKILNEAKTLRHMATLGGFVDFDSVQVVPAEQENGFEIYMLSPRRTSLPQLLERNNVTQLEIINMGLDICAALTTCRHAGFFYANLKPENVFYIGDHYRIGDLGFLPLSCVGHSPLPDDYRNAYTPPELLEGGLPLNHTADVYALGLMLYQAYNGGKLPGKEDVVGRLLAPPKYADYEMAQIILRACAPEPSIRWQDPQQMGDALARYLQRNGMHNTPIIPPASAQANADCFSAVEEFLPEEYTDEEFEEPLWDKGSQQAPAVSPSRKRKISRRLCLILIALLTLILVVELAVGIWLLSGNRETDTPQPAHSLFSACQVSQQKKEIR